MTDEPDLPEPMRAMLAEIAATDPDNSFTSPAQAKFILGTTTHALQAFARYLDENGWEIVRRTP